MKNAYEQTRAFRRFSSFFFLRIIQFSLRVQRPFQTVASSFLPFVFILTGLEECSNFGTVGIKRLRTPPHSTEIVCLQIFKRGWDKKNPLTEEKKIFTKNMLERRRLYEKGEEKTSLFLFVYQSGLNPRPLLYTFVINVGLLLVTRRSGRLSRHTYPIFSFRLIMTWFFFQHILTANDELSQRW